MGKIKVKVFTLEDGLKEYNDVKLIRIKSEKYNLLIMEDYLSILGDLIGDIDIESDDLSVNLQDIKGYYMHSDNVFSLVVKED